jgi:hypothetical protein
MVAVETSYHGWSGSKNTQINSSEYSETNTAS